ncbi:helix-turn-helix domain-containing protein [Actinomyces sp. S4-C9]|uniref:helix-turn-helix domain-containing protein n=1 Tax=Actinomyces sp. S4-C9 TaxID=1219581 RepID=UPI00050F14E0|nr:helix-turn-helix domain-containing protein [Actinomyces sp. S4-C9]KGF01673.1 hypothetical protein HMPREF1628_05035 [Actinomyces sp. S4-C9]
MNQFVGGSLTVEEAADLLGVSRKTLYVWIAKGLVPSVRIGKRIKLDGQLIKNVATTGLDLERGVASE